MLCAHCGKTVDEIFVVDGFDYCPECHDELFTECEDCGEPIPRNGCKEFDGEVYCDDCHEDRFTVCADCGETIPQDDCHEYDYKSYCESCYDDRFTVCNSCDETIRRDRCYSTDCGDDYCEGCYSERYTHCESCEEEISRDECCTSDDGNDYCGDCYNERFTRCERCNCEIENENAVEYNGEYYCERCANARWRAERFTPSDSFSLIGSTRKFGVELETASCDHYGELRGKTVFGCKDDGSIDGKEFVSPILSSDAGLEAIDTFCDLAARHEFAVDKKCGFHAHFDLGEESIDALRRIARAYLKTQNLWLRFASESRRENHYCQHIDWDSETIDRQETTGDFYNFAQNLDRYQWCNFAAYAEHSTVEIRLHTSTLDEDKISNWVKAHARFIDWAVSATDEEIDGLPSNLSAQFDMLCEIWADESLAVFYRRRAKKFGTTLETLAVA